MTHELDAPIRIVIADDDPHFRRGLRCALEAADAHIEVVAEAADGLEASEQCRGLEPDVVLLDIHMPRCDGITAARAIAAAVPNTRILMLTVTDDPRDLADATISGADGYLLKERSLDEVVDAVVSLAYGNPWPVTAS